MGKILGIFGFLKTFWKHFENSTLHGTLGKIFFRKVTPKHVQNTIGQFWERFWAFLEFWKILDFLKTFRRLDPPWNTGQKNFSKKLPPKHVQNTFGRFGNNFGHFWIFENFLKTFRKLHRTLGKKKFSKKVPPKHVQNTIGHFWERFWAFLEFWNFFYLLKTFRRLDPARKTGQKKNFEKSTPKTCSKHNWTLLGTILGIFGLLKIFRFFENISKTRPSMEHWAKIVYKKNTPKHVQNTFRQFGNNSGHFWNYENFSIFWKHFEDSTLHGTLGNNFFRKVPPKHVQNTIGQFW